MSARLGVCLFVVATFVSGCGSEGGDPLTKGLEAHAAGKLEEAERFYRAALADDPSDKFAHYNLGLIAQTQGNESSAVSEYQRTLAVDPQFVPALFNLAVLRTKNDAAEAIELYRKIIGIEPNHATAHLNLGFLLRAFGKATEGKAELDKAVKLDPSLAGRVKPRPSAGPATPGP